MLFYHVCIQVVRNHNCFKQTTPFLSETVKYKVTLTYTYKTAHTESLHRVRPMEAHSEELRIYIYIYSLTSQISDTKLVSPRTEVLSLGEFKLFQIVF